MNRMQKLGWTAALAAASVALATAAGAADLPTRKSPPPPMVPVAPPFSWTGFYVGATVGGVWGTGTASANATYNGHVLGSAYIPTSLGNGSSGWLGGGEVGYNYQMGSAVVGVEDDLQWVTNSKSATYTGATLGPPINGNLTTTLSSRLNWLGTTRLRLGFSPMPDNHLLLYVDGGLAYGGGSASINSIAPNGDTFYGSNGATQVGWAVGAGAEYALTYNWTIKAEYLYYDLGTYNYYTTGSGPVASNLTFNAKVNPEGSIARVGVNYKF